MPQDGCSPGSLMGSKCLGTVSYLRKDWISAHPSLFLSLRQVLGRISVLGDGEHWDGSLEALALVLQSPGASRRELLRPDEVAGSWLGRFKLLPCQVGTSATLLLLKPCKREESSLQLTWEKSGWL